MIEALMSLPTLLGLLLFVGLTTAVGLAVQFLTHQLHMRFEHDETKTEIRDATGTLFRVAGWLFTLLLSLTFTDVIRDLVVAETAVKGEAVAISDIHDNLRLFGLEETIKVREHLTGYTQSVIDDDWPALGQQELSKRTSELWRQVVMASLALEAPDGAHEALRARIFTDLDLVSDHRLARLQQSRERPTLVLAVVYFGYIVTMVYFGVYRPRRALVILMSFYTVFVGVTIYLMVAMSAPFHGSTTVESAPIESVLEEMRAADGKPSP